MIIEDALCFTQDDELTIIDVRKFKAINKRKFPYEVVTINLTWDVLTFAGCIHSSIDVAFLSEHLSVCTHLVAHDPS